MSNRLAVHYHPFSCTILQPPLYNPLSVQFTLQSQSVFQAFQTILTEIYRLVSKRPIDGGAGGAGKKDAPSAGESIPQSYVAVVIVVALVEHLLDIHNQVWPLLRLKSPPRKAAAAKWIFLGFIFALQVLAFLFFSVSPLAPQSIKYSDCRVRREQLLLRGILNFKKAGLW